MSYVAMSRPLRIQYPDAYYHVTCRGNEGKVIFRNTEDRKGFFRLLARSVDVFDVRLLAFALMPNHFHLLVCTPRSNLSELMRHFNISYTGFFNRKYHRSGHLYQGRYKAFLIDENNYLLEVSRYIHLNPLRMKSKKPAQERWQDLTMNDSTSFPGYLQQKHRKSFVHYRTILDYFGEEGLKSTQDYKKFVAEGMKEDIPSPLEKGKGSGIIGKDDFVEKIKEIFRREYGKDQKVSRREQPAFREWDRIVNPHDLIDHYAQLIKMDTEELTRKGKQSMERAMLMELLYRLCKLTQPEIGKLVGGIDYSAVSQARKRLQVKLQNEPCHGERFKQLQEKLDQMSRIKI